MNSNQCSNDFVRGWLVTVFPQRSGISTEWLSSKAEFGGILGDNPGCLAGHRSHCNKMTVAGRDDYENLLTSRCALYQSIIHSLTRYVHCLVMDYEHGWISRPAADLQPPETTILLQRRCLQYLATLALISICCCKFLLCRPTRNFNNRKCSE